jgi:two-component system, NtrC family, sensor kinase
MSAGFSRTVSLRTKFVIFIGAIISAFYIFVLYRTAAFDEQMILKQAEQQARMLHKQILLTRQWASDHNGLFVRKKKEGDRDEYYNLPTITNTAGQTFYMRNPSMITRELSAYAKRDGLGFFKITSLDPVNPNNSPDQIETKALHDFDSGSEEAIVLDEDEMGKIVRFIAPLKVTESCLGCHAENGYSLGDTRGALSIRIPINWAAELKQRNLHSLIIIGVVSILVVTIALFLMFESLIVQRIHRLSEAMDRFPEEVPDTSTLPSLFGDELDVVSDNFLMFCNRLKKSQDDLLKTKTHAHQSEKMASLGILSAGIAHEVNNPLGGMLNCVKAMRENPEDRELLERYLPLLDKGLRQIETIMRQLLNFGRTEPLNIRKIDLKNLFEECTQLLSYKFKNINLKTEIDVAHEYLLDAETLKQIIINIGLNAIQAMPNGGELVITSKQQGDDLVLSFRDTGVGINAEDLPYIFDPFFTTKDVGEGTGLGLAVTYTQVQRLQGTISVDSEPDKGALFTITFPVSGQVDSDVTPGSAN